MLAALVVQTKKAGEETDNEERAEGKTESMLKLAGHLFVHCRCFLAVAAQCGVPIPDRRSSALDQSLLSEGDESEDRGKPASTTIGVVHRPQMRQREATATPRAVRSMGDLRTPRQGVGGCDAPPVPSLRGTARPGQTRRASEHGHRGGQSSISSISSTSSSSSSQLIRTLLMLEFPSGPTLAAQVLDALRHTRCRPAKLRGAREGLYSMTTALADAVCMLTSASAMSEEEKAALLRSAMGALKVAADCAAAVKLFLNRTAVGECGLVVHLPRPGQTSPVVGPRAKVVFEEAKGEASPVGMLGQRFVEMEDEDGTIQAFTDAESTW
ncbi:hypothetical protein GLOTRDRAFT_129266 [Gloeophyllum trabeum ATCC 11539]|uniref:Uncharacterized protein n=1 Tax=Gloeophyllum trabeum (strain ATCC 11539 / FP-39264 / Madison 617) TaxID=670483 RepID=S7RKR0_GLOTA|nr:uncharacterized protein GLOTRDRAFT_129266 [Gloeophyllum trabeum ATCC 11539]EPQ54955.1 hypothetical protein GLOTRDRAFT_129266 [Gloeophyllum trabeum ATCC 11539]